MEKTQRSSSFHEGSTGPITKRSTVLTIVLGILCIGVLARTTYRAFVNFSNGYS
jgi:hypothetical protein